MKKENIWHKKEISIREIALEILDERLTEYLYFDSTIAKQYFFICRFTDPIGIHIYNASLEFVEESIKRINHKIIDDIQKRIYSQLPTT